MGRHTFLKLFAPLFVLVLFGGMSFLGQEFVEDLFLESRLDPTSTATLEQTLLDFIFLGGVILSLLLAAVVYLIVANRYRAYSIAGTITQDLFMSREQFRKLYDSGPIPYLLLTNKGTIYQPNKAALRLFKAPSGEDLEGRHFFDLLFDENEAAAPQQLFEEFRRTIAINEREIQLKRKDGVSRWVLLSIFFVGDGGNNEYKGLATLVDITERKEVEKAKTEFVSLASHQLRTPLSTIRWYAELLLGQKAGMLNEKQKHYADKIYQGDKKMIELVDTLLNVSRIEMGTLVAEEKEVNLVEIVESVAEELQPNIEERKLVFEKFFDKELQVIQTDPKLLRIVIQNLLSNAVKYTPDGGHVSISLLWRADGIHVEVADTGYGIPEEQQSQIFTKLFRAENAKKYDTKGIGLGLYMVKSFVDALGGEISFTSKLNQGTTFTVTLPE